MYYTADFVPAALQATIIKLTNPTYIFFKRVWVSYYVIRTYAVYVQYGLVYLEYVQPGTTNTLRIVYGVYEAQQVHVSVHVVHCIHRDEM